MRIRLKLIDVLNYLEPAGPLKGNRKRQFMKLLKKYGLTPFELGLAIGLIKKGYFKIVIPDSE